MVAGEYKARVHIAITKNWKIKMEIKPYWDYELIQIMENNETMVLWDRMVYTSWTVAHIVLKDETERTCIFYRHSSLRNQ